MTTAIVHEPSTRIASRRPAGAWPLVRGARGVALKGLGAPAGGCPPASIPFKKTSSRGASGAGFLSALDRVFAEPDATWTRS